MKYYGQAADITTHSSKTGVVLVNLGTPERPVCPGLRDYLSEFLMDPRVIEIPKLLRMILVKGIIINVRSHKSAATYRQIWTDKGSPLLINSINLGEKVASQLGSEFQVEVAMRYGKPSVAEKLSALHDQGVRKLVVIPLYPQYSGSTNGSTFDAVGKALSKQRWVPSLHFVSDYYQYDTYIQAITNSIRAHWDKHGRKQKLQPYCDETLKSLPAQGVKSVDMICPGFSADCLETLEEIEGENKEYFMHAGGQEYSYIPCLNDSDAHAALMTEIVHNTVQ